MKKFISIITVPAINAGALLFAQLPSFDLFEEIFKLLVLIATFTFTVIRIVVTLKDHIKGKTNKKQHI